MSKQVEERVVSLQFDNKRFESNVSQSMSTLDKLKQKLNLKGASKGLEEVDAAAKKVDMKGLASNVETVSAKFSALDVIGATALANITNSAVEAGKKILSALTIDPVKTGLQEYETKMNAIQVIKAGTRSKYIDNEEQQMKDIEVALKDLNDYADQTIYNYAQMTSNVGKFVNQGLGIKEAVDAVRGMANLAGASGASAEDMARATYQMSQELGGVIRAQGWNSLRNSNMANQDLKETILAFAKVVEGIDVDAYLDKHGTFENTLEEGWLTGDLFTKAMNVYSDVYSEAEYKAMGFNDEQIKNFKGLAEMAKEATTSVKTLSQLWDVLKETAQSGWTQSWEIIIGDFATASKMFSDLNRVFSAIIDRSSKFRNDILESAFGRTFIDLGSRVKAILDKIRGSIDTVSGAIDKATGAVGKVTGALLDYDTLVDQIIRGEWKNAPTRWQDLAAAGYDWAHAQNLVNERLGCSVRHATNYKETQDGLNKSQEKSVETQKQLTKTDAKLLEELLSLTDAQLKAKNLTDDEIKSLRELEDLAKRLGMPISELLENLDKINGRWLIMEGFKNIGKSIASVFKAMGEAWKEIFESEGVTTVERIANALFNAMAAFYKFSRSLIVSKENSDKLKRTFKGLFAILDLLFVIVGGPIKLAFKVLSKILGAFNLNILDLTAIIGDAVVGFHDWLMDLIDFEAIAEWLAPYIQKATDAIKKWVEETKPLEKIATFFDKIGAAVKKAFAEFKNSEAYETGKNIIAGLWQGIQNGALKLWDVIKNVFTTLIDKAKEILGIHSPSVVFAAIGGFIIAGLAMGLKDGFPGIFDIFKGFFDKIISFAQSIDWGAILTAASSIGFLFIGNKFASAFQSVAGAIENVGEAIASIGIGIMKMGVGLKKLWKAKAWEARSKAILNFAIAVGILAASVYVLAQLDTGKLWGAIGAITVLAVILIGLSLAIVAMNKLGSISITKTGLNVSRVTSQILPIAIALLVVASAVKKLAGLSVDEIRQGTKAVIALGGLLVAIMWSTKFINPVAAAGIGGKLIAISAAILILVFVVKQIARMDGAALAKGISVMVLFGAFIVGLMAATKLAGPNVLGLGATMLGIASAILILVFTARIIAAMDIEALVKGAVGIAIFGTLVAGLIFITRLAGGAGVARVGSTILAISVAMLLMSGVAAILGAMEISALIKGIIAIKLFSSIIRNLIITIGVQGRQVRGIGFTILAIAFAIGILAGVPVLLGLVSLEHLAKGLVAVGLLSAMMTAMLKATKGISKRVGTMVVLVVAIGILAAAVAGLSFIDPVNLAAATGALSAVMGVFAVLLKTMGSMQTLAVMSWSSVGKLAVMFGMLAGVMVALAFVLVKMKDIDPVSAITNAIALSVLLVAITAMLTPLCAVGQIIFATKGKALLGIAALAAMIIPLFGFVWVLNTMSGVQNAIQNALALSILASVLTVLLIPLCRVGVLMFASAGVCAIGIAALAAMIIPMFAFVWVLKSMQNIQNATENALLLSTLMVVMTAVLAVLAFVGPAALIGVSALTALSKFMLAMGVVVTAIGWLMDKCPSIETFIDKGITIMVKLAEGLGEMIGAFVGGALAGLTAGLPQIGKNLSSFMTEAQGFIDGASNIKPEMTKGISALAEAILTIAGSNLLDKIAGLFGGGSSVEVFGEKLKALGKGIVSFTSELTKGKITGDSVTLAKNAADIIKELSSAAAEIPNTGGWLSDIVGDNDMKAWSEQLPKVAEGLVKFTTELTNGGITKDSVDLAEHAADIVKALASAASEIPNAGGALWLIVGDNDFEKWAGQLPKVGEGIAGFASELGEFSTGKIASIEAGVKAIEAISAMSKEYDSIDDMGDFSGFGNGMIKLAKKIKEFVDKISEVGGDAITSAIDEVKKIIDLAKTVAGTNIEACKTFGDSLKTVAEDGVEGFVGAFTSKDAGKKVKNAVVAMANNAVSALKGAGDGDGKSTKDHFTSVGKDCVQGFINGMKNKDKAAQVVAAGTSLGKAALKAAKAALDEHSPSREMYKVGDYAGAGLINALYDNISGVYKAGKEMAGSALDGTRSVMARIVDAINSDMDAQPSIRPVLDLTDVRSGVNSIGDMLSGARTVSVNTAGIGAISANMANRQNGNDLASAINKLAKSNGKSGDTYNFNGFSYSEGSDVANAIQTLVRAAKMEGRT